MFIMSMRIRYFSQFNSHNIQPFTMKFDFQIELGRVSELVFFYTNYLKHFSYYLCTQKQNFIYEEIKYMLSYDASYVVVL